MVRYFFFGIEWRGMSCPALFLVLAMAVTACVTDRDEPEWSLAPGDRVPEFSVTLDDGSVFDSRRDCPSVIVFFNTACPDCRRELPRLQHYYDSIAEVASPAPVLVCIAREEDGESIARYWADNGLTMPYSAQDDRRIYSMFASSGIPRVYTVGSDGLITSVRE